jgi:hypothetical protein
MMPVYVVWISGEDATNFGGSLAYLLLLSIKSDLFLLARPSGSSCFDEEFFGCSAHFSLSFSLAIAVVHSFTYLRRERVIE